MSTKVSTNCQTDDGTLATAVPTVDRLAFSIADAARATSLSRSALYVAIQNGQLRRIKRGRRTLILRGDLLEYLNGAST